MERVAVIDIGSNSVKFFVGEKQENGSVKTVLDQNEVLRLGEGLRECGRLSEDAMERNAAAVARFAVAAKEMGAETVIAVGTMALRSASNAGAFLAQTERLCGVKVRIISGEEEARLSYLSVLSGMSLPEGEVVVFDTGGGSTEFIYGRGKTIVKRFSVDLGSIRITERFFADDPVKAGSVKAAIGAIRSEFSASGAVGLPVHLVGIGGTVTTMAAVKLGLKVYDPAAVHGSVLTRDDVLAQIEAYRTSTLEQRRKMDGLHPKRADIILGGSCIVKTVMECFGREELTVSDRGLRHGLAFEVLCGA